VVDGLETARTEVHERGHGRVSRQLDVRLGEAGGAAGHGMAVGGAGVGDLGMRSRRLGVARKTTVQARRDRSRANGVIRGFGPEVLELHTTTGQGDMPCRSAARSNADLRRVIDRVVGFDGIARASTTIMMENPVPHRIIPLVEQASRDTSEDTSWASGSTSATGTSSS
jgi:hypothetical protein